MDFELRRAREKLEREQKERKERAKLKLQRERKAKEEAQRQRDAIEAAQRSRRLDAIEAQHKAEQQMQETLLAGGGVAFDCTLQAIRFEGPGDKIKLPSSCFTALSDQGAFDKGPLYFQLSVVYQEASAYKENDCEDNCRATHSGVLEFTAEEGSVELPAHVWSNLFPKNNPDNPLVETRYVRLPKGTYAKLQPDDIGFSDLPNHKAILETVLRQHATLSLNDVLTVSYGKLKHKLKVLELKPASSVSVLETDIEVEIVGPDLGPGNPSEYVLRPLTFGKSESGNVAEGKYMYYKFSLDDITAEKVAWGNVRVEVKVNVDKGSGDTDLYVSKHPNLFPTLHQHDWSSHDVGSKSLILGSKDVGLDSGTYTVGLYGFKGRTEFRLSVDIQQNSDDLKMSLKASPSLLSSEIDTVKCRNCSHSIPAKSIMLHEAYCSRHNVVCKHPGCEIVLRVSEAENHVHCGVCGQALQRAEKEKHMKVFHEPLTCGCGVALEKEHMVRHQASECPLRLVTCRFCGDMVQVGGSPVDARDRLRGLSEHESMCGSRTAPCDTCGRSVMLKEMDIHQTAVHRKS